MYKQLDSRQTHVRVKEYMLRKGFIQLGEIDHPPYGRNTIQKLRWNLLCARKSPKNRKCGRDNERKIQKNCIVSINLGMLFLT